VQGVGFRPFVFNLARELKLAGLVGNISGGVAIEVEGPAPEVEQFARRLSSDAPPLAVITRVQRDDLPLRHERAFTIVESDRLDTALTPVPPDIAVCDACLAELRDPADRRYRYPFITCTHCGPRFTIVMDVPYDRARTTMRGFPLCAACAIEYEDPGDRRFHAQPTGCPVCGPAIWLHDAAHPADRPLTGDAAIARVQAAVRDGRIVAIKGVGGFHLACDATNAAAVQALRERKGRAEKPFALMAASIAVVEAYADVSPAARAALESRERPIVLLPRRRDRAGLLPEPVAPGQATLGFMLPYAPLHHLLFDEGPLREGARSSEGESDAGARPWIMTSGNRSDEPIARDNDEALSRLAGIADLFLLHNRDIHVVCDDSVVRATPAGSVPIRCGRGFTPALIPLPRPVPSVLAVGGDLKAAFCVTRDQAAIMSAHLGDMEHVETQEAFQRAIDHFRALFRVAPSAIVADLHPGYHSSAWAAREAGRLGVPLVRVQHHHAHAAAVMAEHGHDGGTPVIAVTFDGTGYGTDGAIWGGEFLIADYRAFTRFAHLRPMPLAGGDAAIRHPARVALMHLAAAGLPWREDLPPVAACPALVRRVLARQLETGAHTVPTTSMGRLFDAVAALIGLRQAASYEGQAAMELEACAAEAADAADAVGDPAAAVTAFAVNLDVDDTAPGDGRPLPRAAVRLIDPRPVLAATIEGLSSGEAPAALAWRFQESVARLIATVCTDARSTHGLHDVVLSGGVFQNAWLLARTRDLLQASGFRVLSHARVPPNDGGLALGQAAIATLGQATLGQHRDLAADIVDR
jgi:hydrogenase maturation protein HypF